MDSLKITIELKKNKNGCFAFLTANKAIFQMFRNGMISDSQYTCYHNTEKEVLKNVLNILNKKIKLEEEVETIKS